MRDLTKVLSDAEAIKLRALLAQTPDLPTDAGFGQEYPKMLFHKEYITLYRLVKNHPDPLVQKEAQQKMPGVLVVVHDIETEEEYLADGWHADPNDILTLPIDQGGLGEVDSRIPTGREGRRAGIQQKASRDHELRELRRRYAELTGKKLDEEPEALPVAVAAPRPTKAPVVTDKRAKVAAATRRATGSGHSAHA